MTAMVEPCHVFQHDELPDSERFFRLLRIISAPQVEATPQEESTGSNIVDCELTTWPMEGAQTYRAVSYTWGDPKSATWIRVNGRQFQVRENCEYALRQVAQHSGPRVYIWIDAICINQADNAEKNHQVSRMGKIFENAEHVLACLGAHDEYSKFLFHTLARRTKLFTRASIHSQMFPYFRRRDDPAFTMRLILWRLGYPEPRYLIRAFLELLSRPYFNRVWTLPELWLARSIDLLIGNDHFPPEPLHGLFRVTKSDFPLIYLWRVPWLIYVPLIQWTVNMRRIIRGLAISVPHLRPISESLSNGGHIEALSQRRHARPNLLKALNMSTLLQCEDIRDRIYALIPVINWNGLKPIQPDYDRDVYDIALDVLRLITLGEDTWRNPVLEIICELQPSIKTSQKLVQAILARRQDNRIQPVVKSPHEEPTPDSRFSWACKGFKLLVDNGVWKMDIPEHNHQRGRKLRCLNDKTPYDADRRKTIISLQKPYYVVTSDNKQLQALLPWSAQPGDWVVGDPMDAGLTFGLILLRERGDGRYSIVGEVRADQRIFDCLDKVGQEFTVFFDLEDLIVLYVGEGQFDWKESDFTSDIDLQLIVNSLENAVCSAEGSSYAEMK